MPARVTADACSATLVRVTRVGVTKRRTETAAEAVVSGAVNRSGRAGDRARRAVEMYHREALARAEAISYNERCDIDNCAPCPGETFDDPLTAARIYGRIEHEIVAR